MHKMWLPVAHRDLELWTSRERQPSGLAVIKDDVQLEVALAKSMAALVSEHFRAIGLVAKAGDLFLK